MSLGKSKNIIIGAASVYLGPSGTAKPAYEDTPTKKSYRETLDAAAGVYTTTGDGTLVTNWRSVGFTTDGLEIATDPTWDGVQVDQLLDDAKTFKSAMTFNLSTTFAEATLENLLIAWGQGDGSFASSGAGFDDAGVLVAGDKEIIVEAGSLGEAPLERGLIAIGNAVEKSGGGYGERVYHAYRVLSVESSSHTLARSEAVSIPVTFRALPDDGNGHYGLVRDRMMS